MLHQTLQIMRTCKTILSMCKKVFASVYHIYGVKRKTQTQNQVAETSKGFNPLFRGMGPLLDF